MNFIFLTHLMSLSVQGMLVYTNYRLYILVYPSNFHAVPIVIII